MYGIKFNIGVLVVAIMLAISCSRKTYSDSGPSKEEKTVEIVPKIDSTAKGDYYRLDSLRITGEMLSIFVQYGGGCKEHVFELLSDGNIIESNPPQINLHLKHNSNHDFCKALIFQELKFNVNKLKYPHTKSVVLILDEKRINYKY
jgi:hypothetical protein